MALSALDCVLHGDLAIYASSELTTGRRLYDLLTEFQLPDTPALLRQLGEDELRSRVLFPNIQAANAFATELRRQLGELVVTPGPFVAPRWDQIEYLAFWETFLRSRVRAVYFKDGWQYSNGCTFEFLVAREVGVPCYSSECRPIDTATAIEMVSAAVAELEYRGLRAPGLQKNRTLLEDLL